MKSKTAGPYKINQVGFHFRVSGPRYSNCFAYQDQARLVEEALNIGYSVANGDRQFIEDLQELVMAHCRHWQAVADAVGAGACGGVDGDIKDPLSTSAVIIEEVRRLQAMAMGAEALRERLRVVEQALYLDGVMIGPVEKWAKQVVKDLKQYKADAFTFSAGIEHYRNALEAIAELCNKGATPRTLQVIAREALKAP